MTVQKSIEFVNDMYGTFRKNGPFSNESTRNAKRNCRARGRYIGRRCKHNLNLRNVYEYCLNPLKTELYGIDTTEFRGNVYEYCLHL
jgi:hypothetical protein